MSTTNKLRDQHGNTIAILASGGGLAATYPSTSPDLEPWVPDLTVNATNATASDTNPVMDGAAAPGINAQYSRRDHVHPSDTSRAADNAVVKLTGNQTIAGIKTLSSAPLFPTPGPFANDAAAAIGGVAIGHQYYVTTTGVVQVRLA